MFRNWFKRTLNLIDFFSDGQTVVTLRLANGVFGKALGFILSFILIENLSLEGYGLFINFSYWLSFGVIFAVGFNYAFVRLSLGGEAENFKSGMRTLSLGENLFQVVFVTILIAGFYSIPFEGGEEQLFWLIGVATIFFSRLSSFVRTEMKALKQLIECSWIDLTSSGIYFVVLVIASYFGLLQVFIGFLVYEILRFVFAIRLSSMSWRVEVPNNSCFRKMISVGQRVWWANSFDQIFANIPIIIGISFLVGDEKGIFAFAVSLASCAVIVTGLTENLIQRKLWILTDSSELRKSVITANLVIVSLFLFGSLVSVAVGFVAQILNEDLGRCFDYLASILALRACSSFRVLYSSLVGRDSLASGGAQAIVGIGKISSFVIAFSFTCWWALLGQELSVESYFWSVSVIWSFGIAFDLSRLYRKDGLTIKGLSSIPLVLVVVLFGVNTIV